VTHVSQTQAYFLTALPWTDLPTELLRAELERRQEDSVKLACGSGDKGYYDTVAHVFALILILALSTICRVLIQLLAICN
jgi:hypothetical protein